MKLAVLDPIVFATGVFWRHEPHQCLKAWLRGIMTPVLTEDILFEYEAVLKQARQEHGFKTDVELWLEAISTSALWVEWRVIGKRMCRDFRDEMLIEAVATAKCHTIITHNPDMTALERPFGIDLYTPREWLGTLTRPQRRRLSHKLPGQLIKCAD